VLYHEYCTAVKATVFGSDGFSMNPP